VEHDTLFNLLEDKMITIIILLVCIALQVIPSQLLVEAKSRHSSINDLTQLGDEAAIIMAMLDIPAMDMGKRKCPQSDTNRQPKRSKTGESDGGGGKKGYP
jgi:hypothetical protein